MGLIRKLFWFAVFLAFTLCWVTLFEHGTEDFTKNVQVEYGLIKGAIEKQVGQPSAKSGEAEKK